MKDMVPVLCGVLATIVFPVLASAQPAHAANSPKAEFQLSEPLAVGSQTVKPGDYRFQCRRIGEQEFLVVTSADDGREVARVLCKPEELSKKVEMSEFRSVPGPGGIRVLSSVRIAGERMAHRVVLD